MMTRIRTAVGRPHRRASALTAALLAGGLLAAGGAATAASAASPSVKSGDVADEKTLASVPAAAPEAPPAGWSAEAVPSKHLDDAVAEPKWHPGLPSAGSEIADADTLASVPAAPAEAPPTSP